MGSLPFGQWVLITDARHQVSESRHPCPCFLCIGCHQVQRIHVVAMVNGETASGVEVPVSVPMEDITPSTFGNLVKRVNRDWEKEHSDQAMSESVHQYINTHLQAQSTLKWLTSWKANCNYNKCKIILSVRFARWLQKGRRWCRNVSSAMKISDSINEGKQIFGQTQTGILFSPAQFFTPLLKTI